MEQVQKFITSDTLINNNEAEIQISITEPENNSEIMDFNINMTDLLMMEAESKYDTLFAISQDPGPERPKFIIPASPRQKRKSDIFEKLQSPSKYATLDYETDVVKEIKYVEDDLKVKEIKFSRSPDSESELHVDIPSDSPYGNYLKPRSPIKARRRLSGLLMTVDSVGQINEYDRGNGDDNMS